MEPAEQRNPWQLYLDYSIRTIKLRVKVLEALRGLTIVAGCFLGYLLVMVAADQLLGGLGKGVRLFGVYGILLLSGVLFLLLVAVPLARRLNDLYAARLIEREHPEFKNSLITALELSTHPELPRSIVSAVRSKAVRDISGVDVYRAVRFGQLKRAAAVSAVLAAGLWID